MDFGPPRCRRVSDVLPGGSWDSGSDPGPLDLIPSGLWEMDSGLGLHDQR